MLWLEYMEQAGAHVLATSEPETSNTINEWYWGSSAERQERVFEKGDVLRPGNHCEGQPC